MEKYYQQYFLHLIDGNAIEANEDYDLHGPETLISRFCKAKDDAMFCIGDPTFGRVYIPKKNIIYISEGAVHKADAGLVNLFMQKEKPNG